MKRFLKILSMIIIFVLVIVAIYIGIQYSLSNATSFGSFVSSSTMFGIPLSAVLWIGAGLLLIAAMLSPEGISAAFGRIAEGLSKTAGGLTKVAGKTLAGAVGGLFGGVLDGGNLLTILAIGGLAYLLWPDAETRRSERDARLASDLRIREMEAERELESRYSADKAGSDSRDNKAMKEITPFNINLLDNEQGGVENVS